MLGPAALPGMGQRGEGLLAVKHVAQVALGRCSKGWLAGLDNANQLSWEKEGRDHLLQHCLAWGEEGGLTWGAADVALKVAKNLVCVMLKG